MTRAFAWANGIAFLAIGLGFALFARAAASGLGIAFAGAAGLGDFRAVYGGMQMALGATILYLALRESFREAVLVGLFAVAGLASLRLLSMAIDGSAGALQWRLLAPELIGVVANGLVLLAATQSAAPERG
jgi:hypothetical protein